MRFRRVIWLVGLLACVCGAAAPLQAQTDEETRRELAKQLFLQANDLSRDGRFGDAIPLYERAVNLAPDVGNLYRNLAMALKAVGRCKDAIGHFNRYLELRPDAPDRQQVRDERRACVDQVGSATGPTTAPSLDGRLSLSCNVEGATVRVDGVTMGRTPLNPLVLQPRTYNISVEKAGYELWQQRLPVDSGRDLVVAVTLLKTEAPGPTVVERPVKRPVNIPAWVTVGAGGAALLTGVALTIVSVLDQKEFDDAGRTSVDGETRIDLSQKRAKQLEDRIQNERLASYVMYGVGGAAVATGVVLFFVLDPGRPAGRGSVAPVGLAPTEGGGLVTYGARF